MEICQTMLNNTYSLDDTKKCYFFKLITEKVLFSVFLFDQIKSASQILNDHDNNQKGVFHFVVPGQNLEIRSQ